MYSSAGLSLMPFTTTTALDYPLNVTFFTFKITRVIAIYMNPTSLRQELLWVDVFPLRPQTMRHSTEHQLGAGGVLILHRFSSPFFLICKLSVAFTGRLTTCHFLALASDLLTLSFPHP